MATPYRGSVRAVILDLGGTHVDGRRRLGEGYGDETEKGDKIPVITLKRTFEWFDLSLSEAAVRAGLGFSRDHIRSIFETDEATAECERFRGRMWTDDDLDEIHESVRRVLKRHITEPELAKPIEGASKAVEILRKHGRKLGCTTGFPGESAEQLYDYVAIEHGTDLDFGAHPDLVASGRPAPWMVL